MVFSSVQCKETASDLDTLFETGFWPNLPNTEGGAAMATNKVVNAVLEPESADSATPVTELEQPPTTFEPPYSSPERSVAATLWAMQVWYEEVNDEARTELVLAARQVRP